MENKLVENLNRLTDLAVKSFDSKYPKCQVCKRHLTDEDDVEFYREYGWCLMCDNEKAEQVKSLYDDINDMAGLPERGL